MAQDMGTAVADILEDAADAFLASHSPEGHEMLLLHVAGLRSFCRYDGSEDYWERVQTILDSFFTSAERAAVCTRLIERTPLHERPECRTFLARALAERRLQLSVLSALQDRPTAER